MMSLTRWRVAVFVGGVLVASAALAESQGVPQGVPPPAAPPATPAPRPPTPTRDPRTPGYVTATNATELPDGAVPSVDKIGNFILGPTHPPAAEMTVKDGVPHGDRSQLHDELDRQQDLSRDRSRARYPCDGRSDRSRQAHRQQRPCSLHAARRRVHPAAIRARHRRAVHRRGRWTRSAVVHGPGQPDRTEARARDDRDLDRRTAAAMRKAASAAWNTTRCRDSTRSLSKPRCCRSSKNNTTCRLTKDPNARATMGCSSGGSAALAMAWYRNDLYHRVLTYSGTYVNQQWPVQPRDAGRRVGISQKPDPEEPGEADPHLAARQRSRQLQRKRRHARLGARQPAHGQSAGRKGLQVPVRVRAAMPATAIAP